MLFVYVVNSQKNLPKIPKSLDVCHNLHSVYNQSCGWRHPRQDKYRGWLYGDFSSHDEISTRFPKLEFLRLYLPKSHPGMRILKNFNLVKMENES